MKKIIILIFAVFFSYHLKATHLMGGEITWECIKTGPKYGQYVFQLKIYRDCQGVPVLSGSGVTNLITHNLPSQPTIAMYEVSVNDLSPTCNTINGPNYQFSCGGTNTGFSGNGNGAVEEHIYRSDTIRILGTPDSNGWHFTWDSCCRNSNITNGLANAGFTLRAVMYPFTDSLGVIYPNNDNCYDSSPKFYEKPRTILEVGNGYDTLSLNNGFTYSHNAFDEEQDSISYEWGQPIDVGYDYLNPNSNALVFTPPFSFNNPINGISMNSVTGRTTYPADVQGNYVTCTKVSSFKCGQLVTEIYREIQIVLVPPTCNLGDTTNGNIGADTLCNVRPLVQPPFYYPGASNPFQWDTLVHCGDTVSFDFIASDNDFYPDGTQQNLLFEVSGGQFYNYYDTIPCQNPPCATFVEPVTGASPPFTTPNGAGVGQFEWITSCNHVINSCSGYSPSVYTFVVRVTDDFCPAPAIENTAQVISITVFPPCNLKGNLTINQPSCGLNNGQVIFNPSGGTPPYNTYIFDMNGLPVNRDSLLAGSYQIRITDSTNCESVDTVVLFPSNVLTNSITSSNPFCFGDSSGTVFVNTLGGVPPYSFIWNNGDTSQNLINAIAGTYVLITTDSNNCVLIDSVLLSDPQILTSSVSSIDVLCFGDNTGSINVNVSGGTSPITYLWSNGDTTSSLINLTSDTYSLLVNDSNGCQISETIQILQPTQLLNSLTSSSPTCFGFANGSILSQTSGSVPPYTYTWDNGDTTQHLINITSGQYSVVISDSNNCLLYDTIVLTQPTAMLVVDSSTNVSCFGFANASVTFSLSGGSPSYLVSAFGQTLPILTPTSVTIPTNVPIPAGVYPYTITDSQGCIIQDTVIIDQPNPLINSNTIGFISCNGFNNGSITLNPVGGTSPYTYLWNTGDTTQVLVNIPSGQYFVTIIDSNNCIMVDSILMVQPNQLTDSSFSTSPSCFGNSDGSIGIIPSGGTHPYNFLWNTGDTTQNLQNISAGTYIVSVIDSNNCILYDTINLTEPLPISINGIISDASCSGFSDGNISVSLAGGIGAYTLNWATGDTTFLIDSLSTGWYQVFVSDTNNCSTTDSFFVDEPSLLLDSIIATSPSCFGFSDGSLISIPYGSVPPYNFLWSTGETTQGIQNLSAGQYSVVITDSNNCAFFDTLDLVQPLVLSFSESSDSVSCYGYNDGHVDLSVFGGTSPYSYFWNTTDTTQDISNLTSGSYYVDIYDLNNCLVSTSIFINEPDELVSYFNLNYVSCFGLSDGNIDAVPLGGTLPYSISWSSGDTTEDLQNIPSDMYIFNITDINNCYFTDTIVVFEPNELEAELTFVNGTLVSLGIGGTTPYTYTVYSPTGSIFASTSNNMGVSFTINPVLTGTYTLVVVDANGCTDSSEVTILPSFVGENKFLKDLNVFPNPSRDIFYLSFNSLIKQDIDISIFNLIGEKVFSDFRDNFIGNFKTSLNLAKFGKSMYLLEVKTNSNIYNKKLIIE